MNIQESPELPWNLEREKCVHYNPCLHRHDVQGCSYVVPISVLTKFLSSLCARKTWRLEGKNQKRTTDQQDPSSLVQQLRNFSFGRLIGKSPALRSQESAGGQRSETSPRSEKEEATVTVKVSWGWAEVEVILDYAPEGRIGSSAIGFL